MGTLVAMDGRFEAIENVEAGDQVVSRDDETWEDGKQAVNATFGEYHESVYEITYVVEGDWFKFNKQVTTTAEHPFMVSSVGWTPASQMLVGDRIVTLENDFAIIVAIEEKFEPQYAYNFEVDEFHTYAVTEDLLWVHNECALNNDVPKGAISQAAEARQQVTTLKNFSPEQTRRSAGNARSKHGWDVDHPTILDVRNNPDKLYIGTNSNGNRVSVFYKDGNVVIADGADSTSIITAYGRSAPKNGKIINDKWADDSNFQLVE